MDLSLTTESEAFRDEVRGWLEANHPGRRRRGVAVAEFDFVASGSGSSTRQAGPGSWPEEFGGRGATLIEQAIFNEELARGSVPAPANVLGLVMGGPVVIAHGTNEQKERCLDRSSPARRSGARGSPSPSRARTSPCSSRGR